MNRLNRFCATVLVLLGSWSLSVALAQTPVPPEIAARAYVLLDVGSDQILAQKDIDAPVEPASLTKLMTAYLVFDALRSKKITLDQRFAVSERAWKMPGSRMFIDPKMQVPVEDLLKGMIVQSGNDATVALAEGVAGSVERFVQMMNDQAKLLGLTGTHYANPEGLPAANHLTTARDLSRLAARLMQDFPDYVGYYAIKKYHYPGTPPANDTNRNTLLFRDPTVDGLKTGHTDAAGYCLIATARRAVPSAQGAAPGQRRLISVVLGAASAEARASESQKLLNWGYTAFDAVQLAAPHQALAVSPVWKGRASQVEIGRPSALTVTVPAGAGGQISTQVVRHEPVIAPVRQGQVLGRLRVMVRGELVQELPLVALQSVDEAGVLGRLWDSLRLWLK
ncbi:MAG: D-alanyl-D-alanine carboxypeptidase family protein [Rhodoferax sp.]